MDQLTKKYFFFYVHSEITLIVASSLHKGLTYLPVILLKCHLSLTLEHNLTLIDCCFYAGKWH